MFSLVDHLQRVGSVQVGQVDRRHLNVSHRTSSCRCHRVLHIRIEIVEWRTCVCDRIVVEMLRVSRIMQIMQTCLVCESAVGLVGEASTVNQSLMLDHVLSYYLVL